MGCLIVIGKVHPLQNCEAVTSLELLDTSLVHHDSVIRHLSTKGIDQHLNNTEEFTQRHTLINYTDLSNYRHGSNSLYFAKYTTGILTIFRKSCNDTKCAFLRKLTSCMCTGFAVYLQHTTQAFNICQPTHKIMGECASKERNSLDLAYLNILISFPFVSCYVSMHILCTNDTASSVLIIQDYLCNQICFPIAVLLKFMH